MSRRLPVEVPVGADALERTLIEKGQGFVRRCPECGKLVAQGHDFVALDYPSEPYSEGTGAVWTITRMTGIAYLGTRYVAARANPSVDMRAHRLHEHQEERSQVRRNRMPWHRPGTDKTRDTQA